MQDSVFHQIIKAGDIKEVRNLSKTCATESYKKSMQRIMEHFMSIKQSWLLLELGILNSSLNLGKVNSTNAKDPTR